MVYKAKYIESSDISQNEKMSDIEIKNKENQIEDTIKPKKSI